MNIYLGFLCVFNKDSLWHLVHAYIKTLALHCYLGPDSRELADSDCLTGTDTPAGVEAQLAHTGQVKCRARPHLQTQVRSGQVRSGQVRSGQGRSGQGPRVAMEGERERKGHKRAISISRLWRVFFLVVRKGLIRPKFCQKCPPSWHWVLTYMFSWVGGPQTERETGAVCL